jgi:hypothetical protein
MSGSPTNKTVQESLDLHFYSLAKNKITFIGPLPKGVKDPRFRVRKAQPKKKQVVQYFSEAKIAPVARVQNFKYQIPRMSTGAAGTTVSHTELVQSVLGSVAFTVTTVPVLPGESASFPWLSSVAKNYEKITWQKLEYMYKTKTNTLALGNVILAFEPDVNDGAPATAQIMESYRDSVNTSPWGNVTLKVSKESFTQYKSYFNSSSAQPTSSPGQFLIGTEGQANADKIGNLYVTYVCTLHTPQLGYT